MSSGGGGLVRRRVACSSKTQETTSNNSNSKSQVDNDADVNNEPDLFDKDDTDSRNVKLTLMEEVFLLGLKDKQGYTSFWNDCISVGLRACIMAELILRKRITLEKVSNKRRVNIIMRKVTVISTEHTGDALLDEALNHIHETKPPEDIYSWIHYLSGKYSLKNLLIIISFIVVLYVCNLSNLFLLNNFYYNSYPC